MTRRMHRVDIDKKVRILDDFFKVEEVHLRYERFDGRMSPTVRRLNFERGDSVAVLIFNKRTRSVLLVNQFKYPTHAKGPGWITETAAGMIGSGETAEVAARREVEEEMGYKISSLEHVSTFYVSPGGSSERIVLYYAEVDDIDRVEQGGGVADEQEDIITVDLPLAEASEQVRNGTILDAKTIVGILWLENRLLRNGQPTTSR